MNKRRDNPLIREVVSSMKRESERCLSENIISEFIENKLSKIEREEVLKHLNSCERCFEIFNLSSSILYETKKRKKKEILSYISIAASIMVVFFITLFYSGNSSIKKFAEKDLTISENIVIKRKKEVFKEVNTTKKRQYLYRNKQVKAVKRIKKKIQPTKEKELREEDGKKPSCSTVSLIKSGTGSKYLGIKKTNVKREISVNDGNSGYDKGIKIEEYNLKDEYSLLIKEGYFYKNKNHFKKNLTIKKKIELLKRWEKLLPELTGEHRQIALETIQYLK
jgi:hypothetical protein